MVRVFVGLLVPAALAFAQGEHTMTAIECLENLQNDLSRAIAHGSPSYEVRVRMNELIAKLGNNIGEERSSHRLDGKHVKEEIKSVDKLVKAPGFLPEDGAVAARDGRELEYVIDHGPPVFHGYRNLPR